MVAGTKAHADALWDETAEVIAPLGLRLSVEKTRVCHLDEGFDFLGFHIQRHRKKGTNKLTVYTYPSKKALLSITAKVRALTNKAQSTLQYDDDPLNAPGFQPVLFCEVDGSGNFAGMPTDEQPGATTCLMHTEETPTSGGVLRHDTIISFVDGKLRTSY